MSRRAAFLLALALATAGCTDDESGDGLPRVGSLQVFPASYDLSAGAPMRFIAGLGTGDNLFVSGGTVQMRFFFLGQTEARGRPELLTEADAAFLPLPGEESAAMPEAPTAVPGSEGRGVYKAEPVTFDRDGLWEVEVTAAIDGDERSGRGAFPVLKGPLIPAVGDAAPHTENLTLASKDAPAAAVDSRAATGDIPDSHLHQTTIADAVRAGRPALVVFATPVYCVSKFCGPITDMIAELAREYRDRAEFIHVEIWRDFQNQVVNEGAAEWLLREGDLTEPWVFLIGADGRIAARWDNVAAREEVEPLLRELPPSPS
jgi:hypothetical protein